MEQRDSARNLFWHIIRDGENTKFLSDCWHPNGRLTDWINSDILEDLCANIDCKVAEIIEDNDWLYPDVMDDSMMQIVNNLKEVEYDSSVSDIAVWKPSSSGEFTMKDTYNYLGGERSKIPWQSLVWFKSHVLRHSFITWLGLHGRLKTKDKMVKWGLIHVASCSLCDGSVESEDHLFLSCPFSACIWKRILLKMGYTREACSSWMEEIMWCVRAFAGQGFIARVKKLILNCFVYHIWRERNSRSVL